MRRRFIVCPKRRAISSTMGSASPLSLRRSVMATATTIPVFKSAPIWALYPACTAPSAKRICLASGSVIETIDLEFFLASSPGWVVLRLAFSARSLSRASRAFSARCNVSLAARFDPGKPRRAGKRALARARPDLGTVERNLVEIDHALGNQRRHALAQQTVEDLDMTGAEVGKPVVVHAHPASEPTIGNVAFHQTVEFTRRTHALDRRVNPKREQNLGVGGRAPGFAFPRSDRLIQRTQVQPLDEFPDDARLVVVWQERLQIDHLPPQLRPFRSDNARFIHGAVPKSLGNGITDRTAIKRQFFTASCAGHDNLLVRQPS